MNRSKENEEARLGSVSFATSVDLKAVEAEIARLEGELAAYRRYRELTQEWVQLSIAWSRGKIQQWKAAAARTNSAT